MTNFWVLHMQSARWFGEGSVFHVQSMYLALHILFRPWPCSFTYLYSRFLAFLICGLLKQMFTQNDSKSLQSLKEDISTHCDSSWQPPFLLALGKCLFPHSMQYLGFFVTMLASLTSNTLAHDFAVEQQRKRFPFLWPVPHGKDEVRKRRRCICW